MYMDQLHEILEEMNIMTEMPPVIEDIKDIVEAFELGKQKGKEEGRIEGRVEGRAEFIKFLYGEMS